MISRNVSGEKNKLIRSLPLFIKSLFLSKLYSMGTREYGGVVTNLGKVDLRAEVNDKICKFIFVRPPPNTALKINSGVVGFDNKLVITFGNITESRELERLFLTFLVGHGIPVKVVK
jgi:hypothetical protein